MKKNKNILVTGSAGFIGFHLSKRLSKIKNINIVNIDNINNYYDIRLKKLRIKIWKDHYKENCKKFIFYKIDISNKSQILKITKRFKFDIIINLAAQAGVRYSFKNPSEYTKSNILGFFNILEACRIYKVKKLLYASSSSVYGNQKTYPFKEEDLKNKPIQYYAATKICNEVMASSYSALYNLKTTGLRFFTVYGPFGRPDMAYFNFTKNILQKKMIKVFNGGNHFRDFTYIDDIIDSLVLMINKKQKQNNMIYNIGRGKPESLMKMIRFLEYFLKIKSKIRMVDKQKGDMFKTYASTKKFKKDFKFNSKFSLKEGIKKFVDWYIIYKDAKFDKKN